MGSTQQGHTDVPSVKRALLGGSLGLLAAYLLILTAFIWSTADSTQAPYFDLDGGFAKTAYWITESGGPYGAAIVGMTMLVVFVTRPGVKRRRRECFMLACAVGLCAGLGAACNEYVIKEYFQRPRPNIVSLLDSHQRAVELHSLTRSQSSGRLSEVLAQNDGAIALSPAIKAHWIETTGYSFPSGHSFSAMFFATFFLMLGLTCVSKKRRWCFYALVPWAVAVCYSRTILRVHSPADISAGALQGIVLGMIGFAVTVRLLQRSWSG